MINVSFYTHGAGVSVFICSGADAGRLHNHVIDDAWQVDGRERETVNKWKMERELIGGDGRGEG